MAGGVIGSIIGGVLTGGAGPALGAGIGAAIPSIAEIAKVIVDRTIPDPAQKAEAQKQIEEALTARETALTAALQAQNEQQNAINLAEAQLAAGRPTDALGTLARLEGAKKRASPYGAMQIVSDRGCARARLGRANDAAADLATARAHVADAPEALTRLLLCLGDMDGAAQAMIARLGDRDQRIDALRDLSEFARPSTPPDDPTELRLIELKARPDVKAAAAQAGGTRTFDIGAMDS